MPLHEHVARTLLEQADIPRWGPAFRLALTNGFWDKGDFYGTTHFLTNCAFAIDETRIQSSLDAIRVEIGKELNGKFATIALYIGVANIVMIRVVDKTLPEYQKAIRRPATMPLPEHTDYYFNLSVPTSTASVVSRLKQIKEEAAFFPFPLSSISMTISLDAVKEHV